VTLDEAISGPPDKRVSDPVAIFLVILLAIVTGLTAAAMAWGKRKAVKAVSNSKDVADLILEQQERARLAENEAERKLIEAEIEALRADYVGHREKVDELEQQHQALKEKLDAVSTWDDLLVLPPK
jgi:uncharacterized protein HemX